MRTENKRLFILFQFLIGSVWFINGLYCKLLMQVPRHKAIVAEILGAAYATELTYAIGIGEILLAIAIWINWQTQKIAVLQIVLILCMNILEFSLVPELLLWGRFNLVFALLFSIVIYVHSFIIHRDD